ncbi:hypothetical protein GETHLI_34510 [Geothrix limicola]|uniref:DUF4064 domain-containing protein n=1 Tax=Geothrix limicola TaxID=2927978 RepID=A0ABQ5QJ96_9BACT|nr:hypothetical protein [Geothrix limicola]GLH74949.1 hypothetical protein GETHLI_34510 [Geothrix limicola]
MNFEQDGSRRAALDQLKGPAIALIVTAAIGIALQLFSLLGHMMGTAFPMAMRGYGDNARMAQLMGGGIGMAMAVVGIAFGVVVLMGALKMKDARSYGFAMTAAILAMVPCLSPCCCLGLPFGIWALVILVKPEVKGAFQA